MPMPSIPILNRVMEQLGNILTDDVLTSIIKY
jgi:hypothetical protein